MTHPDPTEITPVALDSSTPPVKTGLSGRLAIWGLILQAVILVAIFLPWSDPDARYESGAFLLWSQLWVVAVFAILPLTCFVIVAGGVSVARGDRLQKMRGWIAIGGAIVVFAISVWAVLAYIAAETTI